MTVKDDFREALRGLIVEFCDRSEDQTAIEEAFTEYPVEVL